MAFGYMSNYYVMCQIANSVKMFSLFCFWPHTSVLHQPHTCWICIRYTSRTCTDNAIVTLSCSKFQPSEIERSLMHLIHSQYLSVSLFSKHLPSAPKAPACLQNHQIHIQDIKPHGLLTASQPVFNPKLCILDSIRNFPINIAYKPVFEGKSDSVHW